MPTKAETAEQLKEGSTVGITGYLKRVSSRKLPHCNSNCLTKQEANK